MVAEDVRVPPPDPSAGRPQRLGPNMARPAPHEVLTLPRVIVAAPHGDLLLGPVGAGPDGMGKLAAAPLDVDEGAVAAFLVQTVDGCVERLIIVHWLSPFPVPPPLRRGAALQTRAGLVRQTYASHCM